MVRRTVMPIVSILGRKKTGKTTFAEKAIRSLAESGYRVGYLKHTDHEMDTDVKGKDTWRGSTAGAVVVVGSTPSQTFVVNKRGIGTIEELIALFEPKVDLVITEGFNQLFKDREDVPKIVIVGDPEGLEWAKTFKGVMALVGPAAKSTGGVPVMSEREAIVKAKEYVENTLEVKRDYEKLPWFDCGYCGFKDCLGFARALARKEVEIEGCRMKEEGISLKVGGREVRMKDFVQSIIRKAVLGMASSLKDVEIKGDESVEVSIKRKKE